jgi:hypothetical protein
MIALSSPAYLGRRHQGGSGAAVTETTMADAVKGPASYFPSIEKTYGQPVEHWFALLRARGTGRKHMELVNWLKKEHGLGHGHANALVAHLLAQGG